jgi:hypothetical protein
MNNVLRKQSLVVEVPVVKAPVRKLRPWVKATVLALAIGTIGAITVKASTNDLADNVKWVEVDAHPGDGYERMVRSVNGHKQLDIKAMSELMMDKNHNSNILAYHSYKVPVLEVK